MSELRHLPVSALRQHETEDAETCAWGRHTW